MLTDLYHDSTQDVHVMSLCQYVRDYITNRKLILTNPIIKLVTCTCIVHGHKL